MKIALQSRRDLRNFRRRRTWVGVSAATGFAVLAAVANGSEVELSADGKRVLIGKDVGQERWSITYNREVGGTVTGNVFSTDGGPPQFVWCEDVSPSEESRDLTLSCFGADPCSAECREEDWMALGNVELPRSFFQESRATSWFSTGDPIVLPEDFFERRGAFEALAPPARIAGMNAPSGFQITPDGLQVLVNKDVGGERWAITRNLDDGTVTGNVFLGPAASAVFVWCAEALPPRQTDDLTLACFVPGPATSPTPGSTPTPAAAPRPSATAGPVPKSTPSPGETPDDTPSPDDTPELGESRCCDPSDGGFECEYRRPEQCAVRGGTDIGPGPCSPNPCGGR